MSHISQDVQRQSAICIEEALKHTKLLIDAELGNLYSQRNPELVASVLREHINLTRTLIAQTTAKKS